MFSKYHESGVSRRRFVTGLAAGTAVAALGWRKAGAAEVSPTQVLRGNNFDLSIGYREVNLTGVPRQATVVNGSLPAPVLRWKQGEKVTLRVKNNLATDSSVHWHGIILPADMDGVP
ncbi:MAG: multicopper oxidase domain-containing protein, partial [Gammaproteobacteria bacterium]|nr:multicopper oxidase domain-containing protein [Gammaproteobacteria bacterium]